MNRVDKSGLVLVVLFGFFVLFWYQFLWPTLAFFALSYINVRGK